MSERNDGPAPPDEPVAAPPALPPLVKKKKKDRVRSAWISFVGRIMAQVIGAAATIVLGVFFVQRYSSDQTRVAPVSEAPQPVPARPRRSAHGTALAVLPLQNFSGDRQQDYFADGMTDALIADLSRIDRLHVISRTSSMLYKDQRKPLPQIAQELGVDLILEGSVAREGERVRITVQLIDAATDEHLWARNYDRTVRNVLALQADIATAIAREVNVALSTTQQSRFSARGAVDPAAYDLYLQGRQAWGQRTPEGFATAARLFQQALDKDPGFALAWAGLSDTYGLQSNYGLRGTAPVGNEASQKSKAAAERAIALDDSLAEAHTSLAAHHHRNEGRLEDADREFRRALELNPGYATAHQWYSILLAERGQEDEAKRHATEAAALDPLAGPMHQTLGLVHYYGRRFDEAVREERRALELAPHLSLAREILVRALVSSGNYDGALAASEQAGPQSSPDLIAARSLAYFRKGDRASAMTLVENLRRKQPFPAEALARWYAATGDRTTGLEMLERSVAAGSTLQQIAGDPVFDGLRSDPRFDALVGRARRR